MIFRHGLTNTMCITCFQCGKASSRDRPDGGDGLVQSGVVVERLGDLLNLAERWGVDPRVSNDEMDVIHGDLKVVYVP